MKIPIKITNDITLFVFCSKCHQSIEATFIVSPDQNKIVISIDPDHTCLEKPLTMAEQQICKLTTKEKQYENL